MGVKKLENICNASECFSCGLMAKRMAAIQINLKIDVNEKQMLFVDPNSRSIKEIYVGCEGEAY